MKRRSFLKGIAALPFMVCFSKDIITDPIELKPRPEMFNMKINGGDGGYIVPQEISDLLLQRIHENKVLSV